MIYNQISWVSFAEFMPLVFVMSGLSSSVDSSISSQVHKIYQLDLFSIINFGLSIAALMVTCFMGLLSWLFYKESKKDSESTQKAVIKIEDLVDNIHHDMMDIIRKVISDMNKIGGNAGSEVLEKKIDDLRRRFDSVIAEKTEISQSVKKEVLDIFSELKVQAEEVKKTENTLKVKSIEMSMEEIDRERIRQKIFDPERYANNLEESKKGNKEMRS